MSSAGSIAPYLGMAAAAFGFAGSLTILLATWGTIGLRRTIVKADEVRVNDATTANVMTLLKMELSQEQLDELKAEALCYKIGAGLLAAGFALAFIRELL